MRERFDRRRQVSEMQSWDAHCSFCHDSLDFQMTKRRSLEWTPGPLQRLEACVLRDFAKSQSIICWEMFSAFGASKFFFAIK
jgi:hypothetical protein